MVPPIIRKAKAQAEGYADVIIDALPGTSCPVVESVKGSDFCILATEPTPFGLYDLKLAVDVLRKLGIPFGAVANRSDIGDDRVDRFCAESGIPILLRIPFERRIAEAYSRGISIAEAAPEYKEYFKTLSKRVSDKFSTSRA